MERLPSKVVSIVVPTYKLAQLLPATLVSIEQQKFKDFEVIVVDDGSPDDVLNAAKPFMDKDSRFRYVRQTNRGLPAARNFGYANCSPDSKYIMFLDADDLLQPDALMEMTSHLDRNSAAGMVYSRPAIIDESGRELDSRNWPRGWAYGPRLLNDNDIVTPFEAIYSLTAAIICSLSLIRRSIYETIGGFDEEFGHHREDTNVFLSIALRAEVHYLSRRLVCYRVRENQMSSDRIGLASQAEKLFQLWAKKELPPHDRSVVDRAEAFRNSLALRDRITVNCCFNHWRAGEYRLACRIYFGWVRRYLVRKFVNSSLRFRDEKKPQRKSLP